jgi:microcystin-dependent protein
MRTNTVLLTGLFFICLVVAGFSKQIDWGHADTSSVPIGTIFMYGAPVVPSGWLLCDGATVSRTTYKKLHARIGGTYGNGDGTTTFKLPDFRGVFPKGFGQNGALGSDYANASGTPSSDRFQGHYHQVHKAGQQQFRQSTSRTSAAGSDSIFPEQYAVPDIYASDIISGTNGTPRVASITEPANVGVYFIIYAGQ